MAKPRWTEVLEAALFASRWVLVPFYVGLAIALVALLGVFAMELPREILHLAAVAPQKRPEAGILMALSLIDITLAANLMVIVILAGYETFVSHIRAAPDGERPAWMGTVDFSGLKVRLISSIVAISVVALLRTFLELDDQPPAHWVLVWQVVITATFALSGVLFAVMDQIVSRTPRH